MGLVPTTYKSWELILQVLHQLVQDETGHSTTSQPTNAAGRCFSLRKLLLQIAVNSLWMEHFVTQDEFSHPWKCFQAVSKQVYSSSQTHRKWKMAPLMVKGKKSLLFLRKKNIHSLHTSTHDFVFGPPRKKGRKRKLATFIHHCHLRQQFPGASNVTFSASVLLNVFVIVDVATNVTT